MKAVVTLCIMLLGMNLCVGQSLVGTWQLIKQTTCLDDDLQTDDATKDLVDDFSNMASPSTQLVKFHANHTCEVATVIDKKKAKESKALLYKHAGENLYILDKRSQTIRSIYTIEKLTTDSLIYTNSKRPCETKIFLKIKDQP